jgi:Tfp pilus assembly protein PilP
MKKTMNNILYLLLILLFLLQRTGCKKHQAPAQKPMTDKAQSQEAKSAPNAAEEAKKVETEEYRYDAKGRRDPFLSLVALTKQKPSRKKGATPFESYDIDEVQLLAIAKANNKYYALIQLPDRKSYTIKEGMSLGLQGGKVEKITKDSVFIREFVKDYRGDIKPRDSILKLHKGEGE